MLPPEKTLATRICVTERCDTDALNTQLPSTQLLGNVWCSATP